MMTTSMARWKVVLLIHACLIPVAVFPQIKSIGIPAIVNYSSRDNHNITQTWSICQDKSGIMYFANNNGYLRFDSRNWRQFYLPHRAVSRAIYADLSGPVYVGGFNDMGYFRSGNYQPQDFISLASKLDHTEKHFDDIWRIHALNSAIFFQSFAQLSMLKDEVVTTVKAPSKFQFSSVVHNRLLIVDDTLGLLEFRQNKLSALPGGEKFKNLSVWEILPMQNEQLLVVTEKKGLFIYDGQTLKEWNIKDSQFLKTNKIISAIKAFDRYYIFGTILNGILVIDSEGNTIQHLNKKKGLQSNTIQCLFLDRNNGLWAGSDYGIDYIEIASPITYFDHRMGIQGSVYAMIKNRDEIYIGANTGVYHNRLGNPLTAEVNFTVLPETGGQTWCFYPFEDAVLCGHNNGSYVIEKNVAAQISNYNGGWLFWEDDAYPGYVLQGTYNGILVYEKNEHTLKLRNKIEGFGESSRIVEKDGGGNYWVAHPYKGMFRIRFNTNLTKISDYEFYGPKQGVPDNVYVYQVNGKMIFTGKTGIYTFNEKNNNFDKDDSLTVAFGGEGQIFGIREDRDGNIWYEQRQFIRQFKKEGNGYRKVLFPALNELNGAIVEGFSFIVPHDSADVYLGSSKGLVHFDPTSVSSQAHIFNCTFPEIVFAYKDTVISLSYSTSNVEQSSFPFSMKGILFNYCATSYNQPDRTEYKYRLKGYDTDWSSWSVKTVKEYTGLMEGNYEFEVIARNYLLQESKPVSFSFIIEPPVYRTSWAYAIYALIVFLSLLLSRKIIRSKFQRQKERLELEKRVAIQKKQQEHEHALLQMEMEKKNAELAAVAMRSSLKNDALINIKKALTDVVDRFDDQNKKLIHEPILLINEAINSDSDWLKFQEYFDQVHDNFSAKLKEKYPTLTTTDLKLCMYLRMQLSTKEIASLMNISIRGVEKARYRLRKKIFIDTDENLTEFIIAQ